MPYYLQYQPEVAICKLLHLKSLSDHHVTIVNERGWRDNERDVEYIWIVTIDHAFRGRAYLFALKFAANIFRDISNPSELVLGLMHIDEEGEPDHSYIHKQPEDFIDPIKGTGVFRLFEGDNGISLDGVTYNVHIMAHNIESKFAFSNPQSPHWQELADHIWQMAGRLAEQSGNEFLLSFIG